LIDLYGKSKMRIETQITTIMRAPSLLTIGLSALLERQGCPSAQYYAVIAVLFFPLTVELEFLGQ